jgi:hypothetical protein
MLPPLLAVALAVAPPFFDEQGRSIGAPLSNRVVQYQIDAKLDPVANTVTGSEQLVWRNRGADPQARLWFHLYWNAFKNDRSTLYWDARRMGGMRDEDSTSPNFPNRKKDEWGFIDVTEFSVHEGASVLSSLKYQHPDDDNAEDETVFTVDLPEPVPAGGSITLDIRWLARVPEIVERAGHVKDYYLLGQWFPKIGVLEIPGERGATAPRWNCHQYHATSEFYADFGVFDAHLTVPAAFKVGATGVLVDTKDQSDGTRTYHFHQDDVHDFAWTAWPKFEVTDVVFEEPDLPKVQITVFLAPQHQRSLPQYVDAIKASLRYYGRWWTAFPYSHLTLVDPPADAIASGGMEYPTFIALVSRNDPGEPKDYEVWSVTAHEFGHNYWYGLVASNEFEEAWLDEGINTYGTSKVCSAENVRRDLNSALPSFLRPWFPGLPAWTEVDSIRAVSGSRWDSPVILAAWKYRSLSDYARNSYPRPAANLYALERIVGEDTMARVMKTYAQRWKFRHPRSEDFFAVAEEESRQDLGWFWKDFFRGTGQLDYAVNDLSCVEHPKNDAKGIFGTGEARKTVEPPKGKPKSDEKGQTYARCEIEVSRVGDIEVPVTLNVTFDDGTSVREIWDGKDRWHRWTYDRPMPDGEVREAALDDHGPLALDMTPHNNSRTRKTNTGSAVAIFGFFTFVGQFLASLLGMFA